MYRIYERVSTKNQNCDSQRPDLDAFAKGKQSKTYTDRGFSGKSMVRPGFGKLLKDLRKGDVLVVWRLDRLGRTAKGLVTLIDDLREKGAYLISLKDGIDTSSQSATQNLLLNVLISVAVFETEVRGERVAAGIAAKRARGEKWGGGRPKGSHHKLTPEVLKTLKAMKSAGDSPTAMSRVLNMSRTTIYEGLNLLAEHS
ncbi:recombinase family protein [Zavarzinella formosa]|uniref:recombinase family protein n=1 Tax=Zavarzinella formosa TaxID=360055 RepID=UPI0002EC2A91|nr:recombinase family protein [Zavarzinella formosa]